MSVTTETLRIVNEVVYKGKGEAQKLDSDLKKVDAGNTKAKMSMGQLATAAGVMAAGFGTVAVGAKKFYDTLKAGADVQAAKFTFDNLTASIGATSDAMLGQLQTSTRGMVSELELMQFANQTVAMGLGSTTEEVGRLAELGSVLGAAFRGDAVAGMEEFNLLLANQSIPRLDTFGISAGAVRTRIAELQAEFPDMSREAAFTQAVLEEGGKTLDKLGDSSVTAASDFAQFEAALKDARDEVLLELVEAFADDMPTAVDKATAAIDRFSEKINSDTIKKGVDTLEVLWKFTAPGMAKALREAIPEVERTADELERMPPHVRAAVKSMNDLAVAIEAPATGMVNWNAIAKDFNDEAERLPPVAISYVNSMTRMGDAHDQLVPAANASTKAVKGFAEFSSTTFLDALDGVDVAAFDVEQALLEQAAAAGADQQSLVLLAAATGNYTEIQIQAALEMAALTAFIDAQAVALAAGNITWREALANVQAFKAELDALPPTKTVQVVYEQVTTGNAPGQGPSISSATGNVFPHGGYSMVGEFGPEFVRLPAGAQVISTNRTVNNSNSTTINGATRRGEQVLLQHLRRQSRPATILG